jgi:hypothetical protein
MLRQVLECASLLVLSGGWRYSKAAEDYRSPRRWLTIDSPGLGITPKLDVQGMREGEPTR